MIGKKSPDILILGWNRFSLAVVQQLLFAGKRISIVVRNAADRQWIEENPDYHLQHIEVYESAHLEDPKVLKKAGIEKVSVVFLNLENDTEKLIALLNLKKIYPSLSYAVSLENPDLKKTFEGAGAGPVLSHEEILAKMIAGYLFEPHVAQYSRELFSTSLMEEENDTRQFPVPEKSAFSDQPYTEVFKELKIRFNLALIGFSRKGGLFKNPSEGTIRPGDEIILMGTRKSMKELAEYLKNGD
jgi:voltage-gated potassium channel